MTGRLGGIGVRVRGLKQQHGFYPENGNADAADKR